MDLRITFPGQKRVDASFDGFTVHTDQPVSGGGEGSAPGPFDLYIASLGACAGIYVLGFCQARQIATEGLVLAQHVDFDPDTHLPTKVSIDVHLPPGFPEKYRAAILRTAEQCKVKKSLAAPPEIRVALAEAAAMLDTASP